MTNDEKMALLMATYDAIFTSKTINQDITTVTVHHPNLLQWINNQWQPSGMQAGRWFKNSVTGQRTIRGFDLSILDDNNQILLIRILEQNPDTMTPQGTLKPLANAARQGSRICWIIDRRKKTDAWLGRVQDGQYIAPEPRATYPATYEPNTTYPANATPQPTPPPVTYETSVPEPVYDTLNPNVLDDIPTDLDIPDIVLQHFAEDDYVD